MGLLDRVFRRSENRRGSELPRHPTDVLNLVLCMLSDRDAFTVADACEGVQIFGAVGSGKTSGSGAALARCFLAGGFGGLVLTVKPDECATWERYCAETGRSDDLVIFSPTQPWRFNFLDYELKRTGAGAGLTENIVQLFMLALEAGGRSRESAGSDPFWNDALKELLRNAVELLALAIGSVSLADIYELIDDAPQSLEQLASEEWRRTSTCGQALLAAQATAEANPAKLGDYRQTERYWTKRFPQLAEKTRSIVVTSFSGLADAFLRDPMRTLFCTGTNITPEASQRGKIIVLDLPVKEYNEVGAFAQVLFKLSWQKAIERRDVNENAMPVFLWADECQYFLTAYDQLYLTTARSSRACTVYLTQNLPNYYAAFKGQAGRHQVESILGNLSTKIFHANGDPTTNEYAAKTIAQTWQGKMTATRGASSGNSVGGGMEGKGNVNFGESGGSSISEQLAFQVLPQEFTTLATGGTANGLVVEGVVFKSGRVWRATGTNYLPVVFHQKA